MSPDQNSLQFSETVRTRILLQEGRVWYRPHNDCINNHCTVQYKLGGGCRDTAHTLNKSIKHKRLHGIDFCQLRFQPEKQSLLHVSSETSGQVRSFLHTETAVEPIPHHRPFILRCKQDRTYLLSCWISIIGGTDHRGRDCYWINWGATTGRRNVREGLI